MVRRGGQHGHKNQAFRPDHRGRRQHRAARARQRDAARPAADDPVLRGGARRHARPVYFRRPGEHVGQLRSHADPHAEPRPAAAGGARHDRLRGARSRGAEEAHGARRPGSAGNEVFLEEKDGVVEATCPWGNRVRCHAPAPEFGDTELGLAYVEFDVPPRSADGIARFYTEIMDAPSKVVKRHGAPSAEVPIGRGQRLWYTETREAIPPYDGHHIEMYIAEFSTPYKELLERGLITMETDEHEWRFQSIVDPKSGKPLFEIEHEVRSLKHPLYARPLVNRNPLQTNTAYQRNQDAFRSKY